ncbi:MAG: hypothetical protein OEL56_06970 [Nitrosopumilus sp.]|nr:hypothetical protein [Nitrosopumilus sp.]MDH3490174.1 hypothetical protein [Nitrosopumilus sp.]MDH3516913.1 hypothetical protein [Nitrosopumilus sp.]MDH3565288.1 hypothetical protein [Nitrosopumilus sp.]MDH5416656.1 hypothetical protein [Nitrosopumilus sp.]
MRQIFVILAVGVPLLFAALFIVNGIISETFPMFIETPFDESQNLQQTYQAGLNHCENNYGKSDALDKKNRYEECVDLVEKWYAENIEK